MITNSGTSTSAAPGFGSKALITLAALGAITFIVVAALPRSLFARFANPGCDPASMT